MVASTLKAATRITKQVTTIAIVPPPLQLERSSQLSKQSLQKETVGQRATPGLVAGLIRLHLVGERTTKVVSYFTYIKYKLQLNMKLFIKYLSCIVIVFSSLLPCHAQNLAQASKVSFYIDQNLKELDQANINLLQMSAGINSSDEINVSSAADCINSTSYAISMLNTYISIYSMMIDRRDQAYVKKFIPIQSKSSIKISEYCIGRLNKVLTSIKNQSVTLEVERARDLIINLRNEIADLPQK